MRSTVVGLGGLLVIALGSLGTAVTSSADQSDQNAAVAALSPYIEAHSHFDEHDPKRSVNAAIQALAVQNCVKIYFLTLPDTFDHQGRYDAEVILAVAKKHPDKLGVLGGVEL